MSMSLIRALRVAFVLAWEEPFGRRPHLLRDGAVLSLALITALAGQAGIEYLRHKTGVGVSLLLALVPVALGGCLWVGISLLLPHAQAHWRALVPGAALFAVGVAALHLATVFYFAPRLARAPALYGSLGTAATLLVWLFVIARIAVASAFLNATSWRRNLARGNRPRGAVVRSETG
jgi:membrane protein